VLLVIGQKLGIVLEVKNQEIVMPKLSKTWAGEKKQGNRGHKNIVPSIHMALAEHLGMEDGEFAIDCEFPEFMRACKRKMACDEKTAETGFNREWRSFFRPYSRPFRRLFQKRAKTVLGLCKMALDDKNLSVGKARKTLEEIQNQLNS